MVFWEHPDILQQNNFFKKTFFKKMLVSYNYNKAFFPIFFYKQQWFGLVFHLQVNFCIICNHISFFFFFFFRKALLSFTSSFGSLFCCFDDILLICKHLYICEEILSESYFIKYNVTQKFYQN